MTDELGRNEPLDPDSAPPPRPHPAVLVGLGGVLGTAARALLGEIVPDAGGVPVAILVVNLVGAFILGWLLEALARRGPDVGRRRDLRLFCGTGILGGFTTYSALATGTAVLLREGAILTGLGYSLGTVLLGGICTVLGIATGRRLPRLNGAPA